MTPDIAVQINSIYGWYWSANFKSGKVSRQGLFKQITIVIEIMHL